MFCIRDHCTAKLVIHLPTMAAKCQHQVNPTHLLFSFIFIFQPFLLVLSYNDYYNLGYAIGP